MESNHNNKFQHLLEYNVGLHKSASCGDILTEDYPLKELDFDMSESDEEYQPLLNNQSNLIRIRPKKDYWLPYEAKQRKWIKYLKENCGRWVIGKVINNVFHYVTASTNSFNKGI